MKRVTYKTALIVTTIALLTVACKNNSTESATDTDTTQQVDTIYKRVNLPQTPLSLEIPKQAEVAPVPNSDNWSWQNIIFPQYDATLYCSYIPMEGKDLVDLLKESRELIYRQINSRNDVEAISFKDKAKNLTATIYRIKGKTATPIQFTAHTNKYFLRGSLCYNNQVNNDSVTATTQEIESHLIHAIETINIESDATDTP